MIDKKETTTMSASLGEEMHVITYGSHGTPVLVFPTQNGKADQWEGFGMIETLRGPIEDGIIQLFCVDSVDEESWSDTDGDKAYRARRQEDYYHYIVDEFYPTMPRRRPTKPIIVGCSMGANHTLITMLRRPDLFQGCISMSGVYDTDYFWGPWMDSTLYDNAPLAFLQNMPANHPYIKLYNKRKIVVCIGQGAWEDAGLATVHRLDALFKAKGIHTWVDYWGYDVNHDWPWWKKQIVYFLPYVLDKEKAK